MKNQFLLAALLGILGLVIVMFFGKMMNQTYPITHWLGLVYGMFIGFVFAKFYGKLLITMFLSTFVFWTGYSFYLYSINPIMTDKMSKLIGVSPTLLLLIIGILGAILIGFAVWSGILLKKAMEK